MKNQSEGSSQNTFWILNYESLIRQFLGPRKYSKKYLLKWKILWNKKDTKNLTYFLHKLYLSAKKPTKPAASFSAPWQTFQSMTKLPVWRYCFDTSPLNKFRVRVLVKTTWNFVKTSVFCLKVFTKQFLWICLLKTSDAILQRLFFMQVKIRIIATVLRIFATFCRIWIHICRPHKLYHKKDL